jgi:hypothetical protein
VPLPVDGVVAAGEEGVVGDGALAGGDETVTVSKVELAAV